MQVPPASTQMQPASELTTLQLDDGPQCSSPPAISQFMVHLAFSHFASQVLCLQKKVHTQLVHCVSTQAGQSAMHWEPPPVELEETAALIELLAVAIMPLALEVDWPLALPAGLAPPSAPLPPFPELPTPLPAVTLPVPELAPPLPAPPKT
jgi:hypothetical protein